MRRIKCLATVLSVACLVAVAATPASAQNVANPNGTLFGGGNTTPFVWTFGGVTVQCVNVPTAGNPAPRGVNPNATGGPSTRMAVFFPTFNGCTATSGGVAYAATVVANCAWAYAVDTWNGGTGTSTERLQIGLNCGNPLNAVTITIPGLGGCTIGVQQQPLIHNGANININGQNTPWPPASTGIRIANNINNVISRVASAACPLGNPFPLGGLNVAFQHNGWWAGP